MRSHGKRTFAYDQLVLRPGRMGEGVVRFDELSAAQGARIARCRVPWRRGEHTAAGSRC